VEYTSPNENDLSALKDGDLYFSQFFAAYPSPSADSKQTYWVRQKWGTSSITLKQELLLPGGQYTLTADVWKSGLGGDAIISVETQDGNTLQAPSLENKEQWQRSSIQFESDGQASTTIRLSAMHNNNSSEKFIGFDNVVLTRQEPVGIRQTEASSSPAHPAPVYDLQGRRVANPTSKGLYIKDSRKYVNN
jgi:hypothetical protein